MWLFLIWILHTIFRCIIFESREEKIVSAVIPIYNKYVLGRLSDSKKLGIACALSNLLVWVSFLFGYYVEILVYRAINKLPESILQQQNWVDYLPQETVLLNDVSKILFFVIVALYAILWTILMRKFSEKNGSNSWVFLVWLFLPTVMYIYYAIIHKTYYIPKEGLVSYYKEKVTLPNKKDRKKTK